MTSPSQTITIIGAGVLGLSAALMIQSRHAKAQITIVAAELPSLPSTWDSNSSSTAEDSQGQRELRGRPSADYASMWAGAHYRPIPRSTRQLEQEYELALRTRDVMLDIARSMPVEVCGVGVLPGVELLEHPTGVELAMVTGEVYAGSDDGFRVLSETELKEYDAHGSSRESGSARWGCEYSTYCVNVHVYCAWLLERFVLNGGQVIRKRLARLDEAFDIRPHGSTGKPLVVNCSGRNFDTDPAVKMIRGQTVLVKNLYHRTITRQNQDGSWVFLIPRPGGSGTIVGGTKEIDDMETAPRLLARQTLLENSVKYFPDFVDDLSKFEILNDNVGRRPWREGGLRLEAEILSADEKVVHGYGAGGRGYELSWGAAERLADLVDVHFASDVGAKL